MKRFFKVIFVLALLVSALTAQSGSPPSPEIRVTSPQNNTEYNVDSVPLIFSVGSETTSPYVTMKFTEVKCLLDGNLVEQFDNASLVGVFHLTGLSNGNHTLRVSAFVSGSVEVNPFYRIYGFAVTMHLIGLLQPGTVIDSGNIFFTVDVPEPPPSEPSLTGLLFSTALIASAAVVSFGLVVYFLRRKKKSGET
jgi:hypothetical protein